MTTRGMLWFSGVALLCGATACGGGEGSNDGSGGAPSTSGSTTSDTTSTGAGTSTPPPPVEVSCPAGETSCGGKCQKYSCELNPTSAKAFRIALDAARIYWTGFLEGHVLSAPLAGGGGFSSLTTAETTTYGISVDQTGVYWTDAANAFTTNTDPPSGAVFMSPPGGGEPKALAMGLKLPTEIAADETNLYWVDRIDKALMVMPKSGGAPMMLASTVGELIKTGLALDAANVYWVGSSGVMRVAKGGGTPEELFATTKLLEGDIAADADNLYWTDTHEGTVMAMPKGGGMPTTLASGQASPDAIAVDETHVYWANTAGDDVAMKVQKTGGTPAVVVHKDFCTPSDIAVDAKSLYYACLGDSVYKIAKDAAP